MNFRGGIILLLACGAAGGLRGEETETVTLRLIRAYDAAWDRDDHQAMYEMFDPECVFKSPFQMRIGRDDIRDHVFRNTKKFKDTVSVEERSKIDGDLAYSWGSQTFNEYAPDGTVKMKHLARHLFIFTRRPGQDWKFRFLITTEELHAKAGEPFPPPPPSKH